MKTILFILLLIVPMFTYSQKSRVFESLRVDTLRVTDALIVEDNIGETLFSITNDEIAFLRELKSRGLIVENNTIHLSIDSNLTILIVVFLIIAMVNIFNG